MQGGSEADPGRYPYAASLQRTQSHSHFCGGTLIAKDLVLTAAHCVHPDDGKAQRFPYIRIGGTLLSEDPNSEVRLGVNKVQ